MKIEHFALQVDDPRTVAAWYVAHLGLTVVKQAPEAPFMTFLADESGRVMIEIYHNPAAPVPDYAQQHPLVLHLAFVSADPERDKNQLITAGARLVSDQTHPDGSRLVMLRDPWGLALQLCRRAVPLLADRELA